MNSDDLDLQRKKKKRQEDLDKDEVPDGCTSSTFICPDCSGVMQLIFDEAGKLLKIINLRHRS